MQVTPPELTTPLNQIGLLYIEMKYKSDLKKYRKSEEETLPEAQRTQGIECVA